MSSAIVKNGRYTVEPLYQWDVNQVLEIRGLSLPTRPEIHFTNASMERVIVRQSTMDDTGIITVDVPNSLLQKPYKITAYVCIYEGETFESLYTIDIPVKARKKPADYTIEYDNEIYSFNKLENMVKTATVRYDEINTKYAEALALTLDAKDKFKTAIENAEQSKKDYDNAVNVYNNSAKIVADFVDNYDDILSLMGSKANKSTVVEFTLLATDWNGNTYSFENSYPVDTYDIEIALNSTATTEQAEAFNSAQIVGSATSNVVTAFGNVPTVDIPIVIKAVAK
jgi:hypothetical protein